MKRGATLIQMFLVLGLACVLGAVFNNGSPLGLHEADAPRAQSAKPETIVNPPAALPSPLTNAPAKPLPPTPLPTPAAATTIPPSPPGPIAIGELTWPQTKARLADGRTVLVDARIRPYFDAGHIPDAVCLPSDSAAEGFASFKSQFPPPATPLVVYCSGQQCHLSHALATTLATQHGYTNVSVMSGGYNEYLQALATQSAPK